MTRTEKAQKPRKAKPPQTTAQQLSSLIKSARDILRKDKGLNGDIDRLPLLTWVMFLKFLDDLEVEHENQAALDGDPYRPIIEAPYRWRDWAAPANGISGQDLLDFINQDMAVIPHAEGTSIKPGLFKYLRGLADQDEKDGRREVIANVFKGVQNRMESGGLLRDIINKINGIHFNSSEEIHTLSHLYESMLREMRDAAGDSGEFYTPRPVVRFMVAVVDPKLGESVLDPACGTGGFLVEAYDYLKAQVKTTEDRRRLQNEALHGQEAKPLPYMLAQMNLLLHGLEVPRIDYGNTLVGKRITEIGDRERVDVILTNPPFGGEEDRRILHNFPPDKQTAETALLFLQYIMRKLKRPGHGSEKGGRAAVVVPNGTLFGDGICARIKEELLKEFNLHTIVRLPQGAFAPYTDIPANLIFFNRQGPTRDIWYYELPLPEGRKKYTKSAPLQFEEFADCLAWWHNRGSGEAEKEGDKKNTQAWRDDFAKRYSEARAKAEPFWKQAEQERQAATELGKKIREIDLQLNGLADPARKLALQEEQQDLKTRQRRHEDAARAAQREGDAIYWPIYNLDLKNPYGKETLEHVPPKELVAAMLKKEQEVMRLLAEIEALVGEEEG
jgi:type I restriction enzyme M protein